MLDKVRGREESLKKRVQELEIMIDTKQRDERVNEIVDSDFFKDLKKIADDIRAKQDRDEDRREDT